MIKRANETAYLPYVQASLRNVDDEPGAVPLGPIADHAGHARMRYVCPLWPVAGLSGTCIS